MLRIQDRWRESKQEEVGATQDGLGRKGGRQMLMTVLEECRTTSSEPRMNEMRTVTR